MTAHYSRTLYNSFQNISIKSTYELFGLIKLRVSRPAEETRLIACINKHSLRHTPNMGCKTTKHDNERKLSKTHPRSPH